MKITLPTLAFCFTAEYFTPMITTAGYSRFFQLLETISIIENTVNLETLVNRVEIVGEMIDDMIEGRDDPLFANVFNEAAASFLIFYPKKEITATQKSIIFTTNRSQIEGYFFERYKTCCYIFIENGFKKVRTSNFNNEKLNKLWQEYNNLKSRMQTALAVYDLNAINTFNEAVFKVLKSEEETIHLKNSVFKKVDFVTIKADDGGSISSVDDVGNINARFYLRKIIGRLYRYRYELKKDENDITLIVKGPNVTLSGSVDEKLKVELLSIFKPG